jgi:hypothetical protein
MPIWQLSPAACTGQGYRAGAPARRSPVRGENSPPNSDLRDRRQHGAIGYASAHPILARKGR